eukprot:CAMPEP_0194384060 /NCGR_PEP_ID=MMETSP0174-20130528/71651_1 /TAXON_ID=216777 /ORGANISM="Proboscia alata, Strain PI-D3" /LENGTH=142 /DNA_ID=CAMNT_0039170895 /DNA_START=54 /DNA_END=479 /DNA_ORIENTATION=-
MPPNSCHDFTLLFNQIDLGHEALNPVKSFPSQKLNPYSDYPSYDISDIQKAEAQHCQMKEEMEQYWDYPDDYYQGMTVAKREKVETERADAISRVQMIVAQKLKEREQNEPFLAERIEASLQKDSKRRTEEYVNTDPNAGYW